MIHKYLKLIGTYLTLFVFLAGTANITYASMGMEELQEKFAIETGKEWSTATSEERKEFMYTIHGRKEKEDRQKRVEGVSTPYHIRESFRRAKEMKWEDATEKAQKAYVKNYEKLKKRLDKKEGRRIKEKDRRLKKIKKKKQKTKKDLIKKKKKKAKEERKRLKELKKKRKNERKKLKKLGDGTELRKKMKQDRNQRSRTN